MWVKKAKNILLIMMLCLQMFGCDSISNLSLPSINWSPIDWLGDDKDLDDESPDDIDLKAQKTEIIGEKQHVTTLQIESGALDSNIIPDAVITSEWPHEMAQFSGNIKGSTLSNVTSAAVIGEGYDWGEHAIAPSAIIAGDIAVAMDGRGYISAHKITGSILTEILWQNDAIASDDDIITGGLAISEGVIFAITSHGDLVAINVKNGKKLWQQNLNEPIRASLKLRGNNLLVVTADSQLLCFDKSSGAALWQHRSVAQNSGMFGTSLPAINDNALILSFPSGDLSSLNPDNGELLWSDSLQKTDASGKTNRLFSGVDANPILDDNLLISGNLEDLTIAHDATSGARIWELATGIAHNPWVAGDGAFAITNHGEMLAIHKYRGVVAWSSKFAQNNNVRYYGAFLLNGQLLALSQLGEVFAFSPVSGKKLWVRELDYNIAASPAFSGKNALLVTNDAQLLIVK